MNWFWNRTKEETLKLVPVWIFFFLSFSLLRLTQFIILDGVGVKDYKPFAALIGTLLISRVFILVDNLKFVDQFIKRPLIYRILWKTLFYIIGTFIVRYFYILFEFLIVNFNLTYANAEVLKKMKLPHFWLVQIWLVVLVFVFCFSRELIRDLGKDKFRHMLLRKN